LVGALAAANLALGLLPLSLAAAGIHGIGVGGFTPWFTCWSFVQRFRSTSGVARGVDPPEQSIIVAGFLSFLVAPLAIGIAVELVRQSMLK